MPAVFEMSTVSPIKPRPLPGIVGHSQRLMRTTGMNAAGHMTAPGFREGHPYLGDTRRRPVLAFTDDLQALLVRHIWTRPQLLCAGATARLIDRLCMWCRWMMRRARRPANPGAEQDTLAHLVDRLRSEETQDDDIASRKGGDVRPLQNLG
jgi:hypothetical protein